MRPVGAGEIGVVGNPLDAPLHGSSSTRRRSRQGFVVEEIASRNPSLRLSDKAEFSDPDALPPSAAGPRQGHRPLALSWRGCGSRNLRHTASFRDRDRPVPPRSPVGTRRARAAAAAANAFAFLGPCRARRHGKGIAELLAGRSAPSARRLPRQSSRPSQTPSRWIRKPSRCRGADVREGGWSGRTWLLAIAAVSIQKLSGRQ